MMVGMSSGSPRVLGWPAVVIFLLLALDVIGPTDRDATTVEVVVGLAALVCFGAAFLVRPRWSDVLLPVALALLAVSFLIHTWVPDPIAALIGLFLLVLAGRRGVELMRASERETVELRDSD